MGAASSGWSQYVTQGTEQKPREQDKIKIIEGDFKLGDKLCEANKYEESYYRIVLAFEGKPSEEVMLKAYEDFKKEMFVGINKDEYHIDSIFHFDTDDYHIHIRVPKQNLLTNTNLQLYMDSIDRPRKQLIQDYISLKYGFKIAREEQKEIKVNTKVQAIEKWREERNIKPFDFSIRKEKQLQEAELNQHIKSLVDENKINSTDDIKKELESLDLKVLKFDRDRTKEFSYVTIADQKDKKLRLKGELYNPKFYEEKTKNVEVQTTEEVRLKQVKRELRLANEARYKKCSKLFDKQRARADLENRNIILNKGNTNARELTKPQQTRAVHQSDNSRTTERDTTKRTNDLRTLSQVGLVSKQSTTMLLHRNEPNKLERRDRDNNRLRQPDTSNSRTTSKPTTKRGELNDSTRTNAQTSQSQSTATRTEQRPARARSTRRRAIALYKERIAAFEEIRQARERVLRENERAATTMRTNIAFDNFTNRNEYENLFNRIARNLKSTKDKILAKVTELKNKYISFFSKVEKKEPILSEKTKEYIKEKKTQFQKDDTNISKLEFSTMRTKANADIETFKEGQKQIKEQMKNRITSEDLKRDSELINSKNKYKNQDLGRSR